MFHTSLFSLILALEMKWQRKISTAMLFSADEVKNKQKIGFQNYDHRVICSNYPQPTFCNLIHRTLFLSGTYQVRGLKGTVFHQPFLSSLQE